MSVRGRRQTPACRSGGVGGGATRAGVGAAAREPQPIASPPQAKVPAAPPPDSRPVQGRLACTCTVVVPRAVTACPRARHTGSSEGETPSRRSVARYSWSTASYLSRLISAMAAFQFSGVRDYEIKAYVAYSVLPHGARRLSHGGMASQSAAPRAVLLEYVFRISAMGAFQKSQVKD